MAASVMGAVDRTARLWQGMMVGDRSGMALNLVRMMRSGGVVPHSGEPAARSAGGGGEGRGGVKSVSLAEWSMTGYGRVNSMGIQYMLNARCNADARRCSSGSAEASVARQDGGEEQVEQHVVVGGGQGLGKDVEVPLYDADKNRIGSYVLPGDIFDVPIRIDILHRVVRWQLAKRQQGSHKTKTRSEVRGGGRKPWQQKGSGRARQGTIRAPQWRGGGVAHGPVVRSHAHKLQRRVRRLGLKCALSAKAFEGRLMVVDSLRPASPKTKTVDTHVEALLSDATRKSVLLVDSSKEGADGGVDLRIGASNIPWVDVIPSDGLNVYSLLQRDYVVLTKDAVEGVIERLRRPLRPCSRTP